MERRFTDLLIVGAGVAGAYAALSAKAEGARVLVVSKDPLPAGSTPYAQGGIAIPLDDADIEAHLEDTLRAGRGLVEAEVARSILRDAPRVFEHLLELGVPFEPTPTREGGHGRARVRHAGGDRSGMILLETLFSRLDAPRLEGYMATRLLVEGGRVAGAELLSPDGPIWVEAGAVLLASGGLGQLFPVTTNPPGATGDGMVLAWQAGATLRDLEFVQFHPTALPSGDLISEACRGEGAILINARGERFMPGYDPMAELAPRDVVARAVHRERQKTGGVFLDLRPIPDLLVRFPTVVAAARALGFDPQKAPVPVAPAAHYAMGGVKVDAQGFTGIPGLYAVGEVASSGLHGANRLASNSLLEGLVLGERAAASALRALVTPQNPRPLSARSLDPTFVRPLRARMEQAAGLIRREENLEAALEWVQTLPVSETEMAPRPWLEAAHLATLARLLLKAALLREESRGAHFREDFPKPSPAPYHTEVRGLDVVHRVL